MKFQSGELKMKDQVIQYLKASLTSIRCYGNVLAIEEVLERSLHDEHIPQYRFNLVDTDGEIVSPVTSVSDLISTISLASCDISSHIPKGSNVGSTGGTVKVVLNSVKANYVPGVEEDNKNIFRVYGTGGDRFCFYLTYCNDNDATLPLKLTGFSLV